jgi:hypothetical protein
MLTLIASSRYSFEVGWTSGDRNRQMRCGVSIQRGSIRAEWASVWKEPGWSGEDVRIFELMQVILKETYPFVRRDQDFELGWWMPSGPNGNIGIAQTYTNDGRGLTVRSVYVLLWPIVVVALGIGSPLLLSARRLARRNRPGLCPACGYDMKGLAEGAGCPECGKAAATR